MPWVNFSDESIVRTVFYLYRKRSDSCRNFRLDKKFDLGEKIKSGEKKVINKAGIKAYCRGKNESSKRGGRGE